MRGDSSMKKIKFIVLLTIVCLSVSGMAYAATTIAETGGTVQSTYFGGGQFKPSTKVTVIVCASVTDYAASSLHAGASGQSSGLQFATLSTSPALPSIAAPAAGTSTPGACGGGGASASTVPSGWDPSQF